MTQIFSNIIHRVSPNCRQTSQTSFSDSNRIQRNLTLSLSSRRRRTTPTGQRHDAGTGSIPRAAGAGQEAASPSRWGATAGTPGRGGSGGGWGTSSTPGGGTGWGGGSGSGASPSEGGGAPLASPLMWQHLVLVRGVQQAVAGGQAVQLETLLAGVARICKHRAVGTCDGYCNYCIRPA
jgi:hypothetical protein